MEDKFFEQQVNKITQLQLELEEEEAMLFESMRMHQRQNQSGGTASIIYFEDIQRA